MAGPFWPLSFTTSYRGSVLSQLLSRLGIETSTGFQSRSSAVCIVQMSLQLTERQMQELLQTRQIYLEGLGKLLRERADLYAVFQSQQIVCFESHLPSQGFARTFDAAEQLSENLREEQRIWTQMIAVTFRRVSCVPLMQVVPCQAAGPDAGLDIYCVGHFDFDIITKITCHWRESHHDGKIAFWSVISWHHSYQKVLSRIHVPNLSPEHVLCVCRPSSPGSWPRCWFRRGLSPQMYWPSSTVQQIMLEPDPTLAAGYKPCSASALCPRYIGYHQLCSRSCWSLTTILSHIGPLFAACQQLRATTHLFSIHSLSLPNLHHLPTAQ